MFSWKNKFSAKIHPVLGASVGYIKFISMKTESP